MIVAFAGVIVAFSLLFLQNHNIYPTMTVAYLCVIAVQHFLNDPHGKINAGNLSVLVAFNTEVCEVIIV